MGRGDAFKNPFRNEREKMSISATKEILFLNFKNNTSSLLKSL